MNFLNDHILAQANEAAVYNLYLYLAHKATPPEEASLASIVAKLEAALQKDVDSQWNPRDIYRLKVLANAVASNSALAHSKIRYLTRSESGLTACTFTHPRGDIFVVFKGTGSGEWIDNGQGLSGIPEDNAYLSYGADGTPVYLHAVSEDYATDQQVEALNWFHGIVATAGWTLRTPILLTGHSKGGNKAQFVSIHSDLANACYSFDGQGFSPEALASFRERFGPQYEIRRKKIHSFSTDNDYVNVLGERLMPTNQIYYFVSALGLHYPEAMLDTGGRLHPQSRQGRLSRYVEGISRELMKMEPQTRQYAALGIMNIFQTYFTEDTPLGGEIISPEATIAGIGVTVGALLQYLGR